MSNQFYTQSTLSKGNLALAIAATVTTNNDQTSHGVEFFSGTVLYPQILARCFVVLADITSTRYFQHVPANLRDPILSAQGDRLRAEVFSSCNGVYARVDLLEDGFRGRIGFGTTNVDIGPQLRAALIDIKPQDDFKLTIGSEGLTSTHRETLGKNVMSMGEKIHERPVEMPDRWVRALGNTAEIHRDMIHIMTLKGMAAKGFLTTLPAATSVSKEGWLTPTPTGAKLVVRRSENTVFVSGLHRLSALKRIMMHVNDIKFYMLKDKTPGPLLLEVGLPGARLTISLTEKPYVGYSGVGALLEALSSEETNDDAELIRQSLSFDAIIDEEKLRKTWGISQARVENALALLAVSGKIGYDVTEAAYFHRELPEDGKRILKDNPRLVGAKKLLNAVEATTDNHWKVNSKEASYLVNYNPNAPITDGTCTCTWYLENLNRKGPCKHLLAVKLKLQPETRKTLHEVKQL